jgi:hypothetical protein
MLGLIPLFGQEPQKAEGVKKQMRQTRAFATVA